MLNKKELNKLNICETCYSYNPRIKFLTDTRKVCFYNDEYNIDCMVDYKKYDYHDMTNNRIKVYCLDTQQNIIINGSLFKVSETWRIQK